ncbi:MAG TPA: hypothetical protein VF148_02100 [Acidimicrobiia bacterium]
MASVDGGRRVHLVGTIPAESTASALELVNDTVGGSTLDWLPDGETGNRQNWIGRLIENLRSHPDLEVAKEGDWSDYDSTPGFRVRKGHRFDWVELDYFEHFEESWPVFREARSAMGRPDLAFQVGIPGPIDVAFAAFGFNPLLGFRHSRPFEDATAVEIARINAVAGDEIVYQLEIPIEVEIANRIPKLLREAGAKRLARRILRVIRRSPSGTRWGFHLCVGDMNNTAFSRLENASTLVLLANALMDGFPAGRQLEFLHVPLAHGSEPPTADEAFYTPLAGLAVPPEVRLVAGFAHEAQSLEDQLDLRELIETQVRRTVDIAASCGLGRRDLATAESNLKRSKSLVA